MNQDGDTTLEILTTTDLSLTSIMARLALIRLPVMMVSMLLVDSVLVATVMGVVFGATRGFTVLLSAAVRGPDDLRALHRRIDAYDVRVRQAGAVVSLGLGAVAAAMVVG